MERIKLGFELASVAASWPPVSGEWLWFDSEKPFDDAPYRLASVPWFVPGLALGDTIEAVVDESSTVTSWAVVERSGNDLVWLLVDELDLASELEALRALGCQVENYQDYHFAVSVPVEARTADIDPILANVAAKGGQVAFPVWQRETA